MTTRMSLLGVGRDGEERERLESRLQHEEDKAEARRHRIENRQRLWRQKMEVATERWQMRFALLSNVWTLVRQVQPPWFWFLFSIAVASVVLAAVLFIDKLDGIINAPTPPQQIYSPYYVDSELAQLHGHVLCEVYRRASGNQYELTAPIDCKEAIDKAAEFKEAAPDEKIEWNQVTDAKCWVVYEKRRGKDYPLSDCYMDIDDALAIKAELDANATPVSDSRARRQLRDVLESTTPETEPLHTPQSAPALEASSTESEVEGLVGPLDVP